MNSKTLIGAIAGIVVIGLIVLLARKGGDSRMPAAEQYGTDGTSMETGSETATGGMQTGTGTAAGQGAKAGDTVTVNYTGMLEDGTVFDSNVDPRFGHVQPFAFQIGTGMVIKGWDQGLIGAKAGDKKRLTIPSDMAYGPAGSGHPLAGKTLIFDVEVLSVSR